jgi:hypothetical protein
MPRQSWSRWKELNRHRSIINRVLWPLSYTAKVVDPTGLKPAPHGLKGRRSVTRAPGQQHCRLPISDCRLVFEPKMRLRGVNRQLAFGNELAVAEGFEPSHGRINSAVPYQLGYATRIEAGCGDETRTRIISFTRRAL